MKFISNDQANNLLNTVGLKISDWGGIEDKHGKHPDSKYWENLKAPRTDLLNFCHHIVGWLPQGEWKIFQIDNSTGWMDPVQLSFFAGLLYGENHLYSYDQYSDRTVLFEFGSNIEDQKYTELLIANLTYFFLLFKSHAYLTSSGSSHGEMIAIQDGYIYFMCNENVTSINKVITSVNKKPIQSPDWIQKLISEEQEKLIGDTKQE